MPKSYRGHKFILCVIDEMTNYLITMPIYQARSEEIGDSSIDNVISKYGIPEYLIMDQDSAFMSTIMNHLFKRLNIKIKTVAPFNHKSLQAEHGIKLFVYYINQTFDRTRSNMAKILTTSHFSS